MQKGVKTEQEKPENQETGRTITRPWLRPPTVATTVTRQCQPSPPQQPMVARPTTVLP